MPKPKNATPQLNSEPSLIKPRRGRGEGSISKRADGRWQGRVDLGVVNGKRRGKFYYGRTRREVVEKLRTALHDQQQGLPLPNERQTVGAYLDGWLDNTARHSVRASTYDSYSRLLRKNVLPAIGRLPLSRLTAQDLSKLYSTLLDNGLSPRTAQYAHVVLHHALKMAVRWNLIARNPADAVDPPRPQREEVTPLSPEQSRQLLDAARGDPLHALYVLALTTGMRSGELLGLKWADLDVPNARLHVRRQVGRTSQGLVFSEPKTARGRRTITLPAMAIEALRVHRTAQIEARLAVGSVWEDQDLIFANAVGRPLERQNIQRRSFKPLLRRAGLPNIRFHDLRHSAATLLLSLGEHPKVVQERLGHATIAITMDIYSHVMPDIQRDTANKLDAHFGVV